MTDSTPPAIDPQDPLPEASWLWRRVFVFLTTAAVLYLVHGSMVRLGTAAVLQPAQGIPALLGLSKTLLYLVAMLVLFYMVAPSAEQIVKMLQTARLYRSGVQFAATTSPGARQVAVGKPAPDPIPPADGAPDADTGSGGVQVPPDRPEGSLPPPPPRRN